MLLFINPLTSAPYKSVSVSAISSYPLRSGFSECIPLFAAGIYFIKSYTASKEVILMRKFYLGFLLLLMFGSLLMPVSAPAHVDVGISITVAPPAIPVYTQPICPGPNYIWTPGYWAWGPDGYYWVPGTWVVAPAVGVLWTPGYWGWGDGVYVWHAGYWGPRVGFYGGINYGFGYGGVGFAGGEWRGGVFNYNRSVTNVNVTVIHNTYNQTVINNNTTTVNRASFNGGTGG